jgi:hypothetical protein
MSTLTLLSVSSDEFSDIVTLLEESHPNECVISIHKIVNPEFEKRFEQCRTMLTELRGKAPKQCRAFHGCSTQSAENIARSGFNIDYNKVSAYGRGTYFGGMYGVSRSYSVTKKQKDVDYHALIVADILLGKCGRTNSGQQIDTANFDASVDRLDNPSIICLALDDAAIPRYFVQFYVTN